MFTISKQLVDLNSTGLGFVTAVRCIWLQRFLSLFFLVFVFVVVSVVYSSVIVNIKNAIIIVITIVDEELATSLNIKFLKCRLK